MMSIMPNTLYVKEHRNSKEPKEYWLYTTIGVERYKADELYWIWYYDEDYEHICEFRWSKTRIIYTKMLLRLYDNWYLPEFSHHKQVG